MSKYFSLIVCLMLINASSNFSQDFLFINLPEHLDGEYEKLIKANEEGNWLSENELERIRHAKEYEYRAQSIFYEGLVDYGRPQCDDNFEVAFFTFYKYEFPAYPYCLIVYEHKFLDIYIRVTFSILDGYGKESGKIASYKYFDESFKGFELNYGFDEHYFNLMSDLNFSGFAVWFEAEEISRVKFLHDNRDFREIMQGGIRIR